MRRAKLVTEEMLQGAMFNRFATQIDALAARGAFPSAKGRITILRKKLLGAPSERTIELFIEMHRRWGYITDVLKCLEANWNEWATWENRMEILWEKYCELQTSAELIQATYSSMQQIDPQNCGIGGKQYLRWMINRIIEFEGHPGLRFDLLKLAEQRYGSVMNIPKYVKNVNETRQRTMAPPTKPLSPEQIRNFWRGNN